MFKKIPTVLLSQEVIDKALSRAKKIEVPRQIQLSDRVRGEVNSKIAFVEGVAVSHFKRLVKKFPSIEHVHPFYYDLLDMMFDVDRYKVSLSRIQWAQERIIEISTAYIRQAKKSTDPRELNGILKAYYGRYSSLVNSVSKELEYLSKCRDFMKRIPDINTEMPTFIIAGMPNVGKSSLLASITTAKPKIAHYPFTTQSIFIGHCEMSGEPVQVIDTPGILDRPMKERNEMEIKAVSALRRIDGVVLFLIDRSKESFYTVEQQNTLYREIQAMLRRPMVRVQSKMDISEKLEEEIGVSVGSKDSIEFLKEYMNSRLQEARPRDT
ncbi:MAG: 50S ribosome-binding GTPase [Candidatus Thermoplasmatota archaeon]|nr:50S ribosome-binding GTPase [Candidatus Thermoplasmatota archaeon]MCL5793803.1 50S ribosome-binding GTPase [Candidatus Thermoplasmatota archaeon]